MILIVCDTKVSILDILKYRYSYPTILGISILGYDTVSIQNIDTFITIPNPSLVNKPKTRPSQRRTAER